MSDIQPYQNPHFPSWSLKSLGQDACGLIRQDIDSYLHHQQPSLQAKAES